MPRDLIHRYDLTPRAAFVTARIARRSANTPAFKRINRQLTIFWGVVFLLTAVSGVLAIKGSRSTRDFFTWILPIILLVGAFKLQGRYIEYSRARARRV